MLFEGLKYHIPILGTDRQVLLETRRKLDSRGAEWCGDPCSPQCRYIFIHEPGKKRGFLFDTGGDTGGPRSYEHHRDKGDWDWRQLCIHFGRRETKDKDVYKTRRKNVIMVDWIDECIARGRVLNIPRFEMWEVMSDDITAQKEIRRQEAIKKRLDERHNSVAGISKYSGSMGSSGSRTPLPTGGHTPLYNEKRPIPTPAPMQTPAPILSSTSLSASITQSKTPATVLPVDPSLLPPSPPLTATSSMDSIAPQKQMERTGIFDTFTKDRFGKRTFHVCSGMFSVEYLIQAEGGILEEEAKWATFIIIDTITQATREIIRDIAKNQFAVSKLWVEESVKTRTLLDIDKYLIELGSDTPALALNEPLNNISSIDISFKKKSETQGQICQGQMDVDPPIHVTPIEIPSMPRSTHVLEQRVPVALDPRKRPLPQPQSSTEVPAPRQYQAPARVAVDPRRQLQIKPRPSIENTPPPTPPMVTSHQATDPSSLSSRCSIERNHITACKAVPASRPPVKAAPSIPPVIVADRPETPALPVRARQERILGIQSRSQSNTPTPSHTTKRSAEREVSPRTIKRERLSPLASTPVLQTPVHMGEREISIVQATQEMKSQPKPITLLRRQSSPIISRRTFDRPETPPLPLELHEIKKETSPELPLSRSRPVPNTGRSVSISISLDGIRLTQTPGLPPFSIPSMPSSPSIPPAAPAVSSMADSAFENFDRDHVSDDDLREDSPVYIPGETPKTTLSSSLSAAHVSVAHRPSPFPGAVPASTPAADIEDQEMSATPSPSSTEPSTTTAADSDAGSLTSPNARPDNGPLSTTAILAPSTPIRTDACRLTPTPSRTPRTPRSARPSYVDLVRQIASGSSSGSDGGSVSKDKSWTPRRPRGSRQDVAQRIDTLTKELDVWISNGAVMSRTSFLQDMRERLPACDWQTFFYRKKAEIRILLMDMGHNLELLDSLGITMPVT